MNCRVVRPLLSAYLDHQLNPTETCLVESHLTYCCRCDAEYRAVREAKYVVRSLAARAPGDISYRIVARLQDEANHPQPLHSYPALPAPPYPVRRVVAAAALSCMCLLFVAAPFAPATLERYQLWRNARLPLSLNPFDAPILVRNDMLAGIGPYTTATGTRKTARRGFSINAWRVHGKGRSEMTVRNWTEQPLGNSFDRPYTSATMMASFSVP